MFPFSISCGADAIYLVLTSFDRPLKRSWSCEAEQWIMLRFPSVSVHNLGQWGPSTYGCCRKFYVIIGSDRSTRGILGKWMDVWGKAEGDWERERKRKDTRAHIYAKSSPALLRISTITWSILKNSSNSLSHWRPGLDDINPNSSPIVSGWICFL